VVASRSHFATSSSTWSGSLISRWCIQTFGDGCTADLKDLDLSSAGNGIDSDGKRRDAPRGGRTPDYGEQARSASACVPHVHMQAERAAAQRGHADPECGGRAQRGLSHLAQFDNSLSHDTTPSTPSGTCPTGMSPWRVLRARLIGTSHRRRGGVRWPVGSRLLCFSGARLGV
jgi:hypothetical protein